MTVLVSTHYMDEAERCHRITYISYGNLLADGSLSEVIANAGLHTFSLTGEGLNHIAAELQTTQGVDQVAPFGNALHVTGADLAQLEAALAPYKDLSTLTIERSETSLEDVFIKFMSDSTDNVQ